MAEGTALAEDSVAVERQTYGCLRPMSPHASLWQGVVADPAITMDGVQLVELVAASQVAQGVGYRMDLEGVRLLGAAVGPRASPGWAPMLGP